MPAVLFAVLAGVAFWEIQKKKAAGSSPVAPGFFPATSMAQLAPGASQYLPPIAAPDWVRVTYANAMASGNPIQLAGAGQLLQQQGYPELAQGLAGQYQSLTQNPLPLGPAAPAAAAAAGYYRGGVGALARLDPHTVSLLHGMARERKRRRLVHSANMIHAARIRKTA